MNNNRLNHSLAVAKKMIEIGKNCNLNKTDLYNLFVIGINHDIGYEFTNNNLLHNHIGGNILKETGFIYWKEIYYHGEINTKYASLYLDILNQADMQIDINGNDVGYEKRLSDIEKRYGKNSITYKKSYKLIEKLKNRKSWYYVTSKKYKEKIY